MGGGGVEEVGGVFFFFFFFESVHFLFVPEVAVRSRRCEWEVKR